MKPETIQAVTPIFLGSIGGLIGIAVLSSPGISEAKWAAGFGLASTALAGASGLAQTAKNDNILIQKEADNSVQKP